MTLDEFVSGLSSGMTIGIGGWGARHKPTALVRAILRAGISDLTVIAYGGPDTLLLILALCLQPQVATSGSTQQRQNQPRLRVGQCRAHA
jgi:glutaconate CoA-transferase, subunit A